MFHTEHRLSSLGGYLKGADQTVRESKDKDLKDH